MIGCQVENERITKRIFITFSTFQLANIHLQGTEVHLKPKLNVKFLPEDQPAYTYHF